MVTLRQPLTLAEVQQVRVWRNDPAVLPMLRTGFKTEEEQAQFYQDVICNPQANHRYYALEAGGQFIGMGGLTYLDRVPGEAEISLILGPEFRGNGLGRAAVDALLGHAFVSPGLSAVTGECLPTGHLKFWSLLVLTRPEQTHFDWKDDGALTWRWERFPDPQPVIML